MMNRDKLFAQCRALNERFEYEPWTEPAYLVATEFGGLILLESEIPDED